MKKLLVLSLFSVFMAPNAFAATASCSSVTALGFQACEIPASDSDGTDFMISDENDLSLDFIFEKTVGKANRYKEKSGKCEISVEKFSKSFADAKTKDDYMLNLNATVIKVTRGTGCVLKQSNSHSLRSVTGVYVN
jgi:hypothetical protein